MHKEVVGMPHLIENKQPNERNGLRASDEIRASFSYCTHRTCIGESSTDKASKDVAGQSWK
jgi:hypothetical protein